MNRPTSVTVFGVLNIVFGALGLCGMAFSVIFLFGPLGKNNPAVERMLDTSTPYGMFVLVSQPLGVLMAIVLLAAGIGLFNLRPWARTASIAYSVYALVFGLISLVVNYFFYVQPLVAQFDQLEGPARAGVTVGAYTGLFSSCLGFIYPAVLLYFMYRPNVIAAFRGEWAPEADDPFGRPPQPETGNPYQSP